MKANGMKVNTTKGKTELVVVSRIPELHEICMDYYTINQMENYCHLGVNIGEKNSQETEIHNRIAKYNRNVSMMYPPLKDRFVPKECKVIIYKTILRPILLYVSEIQSMTSRTASELQAAEMRVLRLIKGITRRDRIRNAQIRAGLNLVSLLDDIDRKKPRWDGHVNRMSEEKKTKEFLEWFPSSKRTLGRPRMRWIQGINKALKQRGTSIKEVEGSKIYERRGDGETF